jgi:hypothetical protein
VNRHCEGHQCSFVPTSKRKEQEGYSLYVERKTRKEHRARRCLREERGRQQLERESEECSKSGREGAENAVTLKRRAKEVQQSSRLQARNKRSKYAGRRCPCAASGSQMAPPEASPRLRALPALRSWLAYVLPCLDHHNKPTANHHG